MVTMTALALGILGLLLLYAWLGGREDEVDEQAFDVKEFREKYAGRARRDA